MKTIYSNAETIVAFHIGRGGRFYNQGHLTFVGEKKIGDFIEELFWDEDETGETYGVCSHDWKKVVINDEGKAEVIEDED